MLQEHSCIENVYLSPLFDDYEIVSLRRKRKSNGTDFTS